MKLDKQVRGTRILFDEASKRRELLDKLMNIANDAGYQEISLPSLEPADVYTDKAGQEVLNQMYVFQDRKGRDICLRPEATATIQLLADKYWKQQKDVKLWYFEKCWRYERPQAGRYREFWQFGCEWINPSVQDPRGHLIEMARAMVETVTPDFVIDQSVKRGLDYYTEDGFEISCPVLGAQKQVCGGGRYKQGIGFAIGFDRLALLL